MEFAFKLSIHGQRLESSFADLVGQATLAEDLGFDGVYVIDHLLLPGSRLTGYSNADPDHPYFLDAWTTLAAIAQATSRVKIGPQVSPVGLRHPVFLAKWAATVDQISNGRLVLQLGAGHQRIEYESYGFPFPKLSERISALHEGIEVIRALWGSDGPANYDGQHYVLKDVAFWPKPVQVRPPIWLGGASAPVRELVAVLADGWTPASPQGDGLTPQVFGEALAAIRQAAGGRPITGGALFYVVVDDSAEKVDSALSILRRRSDWSSYSAADFKAKAIAIAGSPAQVCEQIAEYRAAGLEHMSVAFLPIDDVAGTRRALVRFAAQIMPAFEGV
jgi:probable F420-dependent oxidoreductase